MKESNQMAEKNRQEVEEQKYVKLVDKSKGSIFKKQLQPAFVLKNFMEKKKIQNGLD